MKKVLITAILCAFFVDTISFATFVGNPVKVKTGGTGLTSPGTSGNVLTSNGTSWVSQTSGGSGSDSVLVKLTDYTLASSDKVVVYSGTNSGTLYLPSCTSTGQKVFTIINDTTVASVDIRTTVPDYLSQGLGQTDLLITEKSTAVQLACAGGTTYYVH